MRVPQGDHLGCLPDSGSPPGASAWLGPWFPPKGGPVASSHFKPHLPPSCPAGGHLWPAVPCQLYIPTACGSVPLLRTLSKGSSGGESEIFRGPGEGMSCCMAPNLEADTQRNETHTSFMAGQLLVVPPYSLLLCIQGLSHVTSGSSFPSPRLPVDLHIPVDSSAQGSTGSDCRHSHSLSRCMCWAWAWLSHFPLGALRATDDTCSLSRWFLPSSHLVLTLMLPGASGSNPCQWYLCCIGSPVAPRPEAGVVAELLRHTIP